MGIIIDVCIIILLILSIFLGYKKGLIGLAFKIASFFIAIIISLILYYPISNFIIQNTEIDNKIEEIIINQVLNDNEEKEQEQEQEQEPEQNENLIVQQIEHYTNEVTENSVKIVAKNMAKTIINFSVIILIYIITRIVLLIFGSISDKIAEIPIIKQCNKLGGIVYGSIRGFLIIYLLFAIFVLISSFVDISQIINTINQSTIGRIIYENNLILKLLF